MGVINTIRHSTVLTNAPLLPELLSSLSESDETQRDDLAPVLQRGLANLAEGRARVKKMGNAIRIWYGRIDGFL
jgi:hypothetical protein